MLKKMFVVCLLLVSVFALAACRPAEKTFEGSGITIILTDSFIKKDVIQAPFYLESTQHIFTGLRESRATIQSMGIYSLEG